MLNVLITGYSGFVGSHLLEQLKDNFNLSLLGRTKPNINCKFLYASIDDSTDYSSFLEDVDVIVHVAARVHIMMDTENDPLEEYRAINVRGTINLAEQAAKQGVKRFIFVSSIKVNGEKTLPNKPFSEADSRLPEDDYGLSKKEAEEQLEIISGQTRMEYVFIRPPLVYGQGVKANFASLFKFVGKRIPLPFRAITNNRRSLVSVYNLIDLIKVCVDHPNAANQIFLVSDDKDISTSEMVALMAKVQGFPNFSLPLPLCCFHLLGKLLSKQDIIDRLVGSLQVDITHTKNTLNWTPPFSIEEGFAKCIEKKDV